VRKNSHLTLAVFVKDAIDTASRKRLSAAFRRRVKAPLVSQISRDVRKRLASLFTDPVRFCPDCAIPLGRIFCLCSLNCAVWLISRS